MITAKTTALLLAMSLVSAATPAAFGQIAVVTGTSQDADNEDNDKVEQKNSAKVKNKATNIASANTGVVDSAFVAQGASGPATAASSSIQTTTIGQANVNTDNDVQDIDQCASGPSVLPILSCADVEGVDLGDLDLEELLGGLGGGAGLTN